MAIPLPERFRRGLRIVPITDSREHRFNAVHEIELWKHPAVAVESGTSTRSRTFGVSLLASARRDRVTDPARSLPRSSNTSVHVLRRAPARPQDGALLELAD